MKKFDLFNGIRAPLFAETLYPLLATGAILHIYPAMTTLEQIEQQVKELPLVAFAL